MTYSQHAQKSATQPRSWWRNERGIGVVELGVVAAILITVSTVVAPQIRNARDRRTVTQCAAVATVVQGLLQSATSEADKIAIVNSENGKQLITCRTEIQRILNENASVASLPTTEAALKKILEVIEQGGQCSFSLTSPSSKPAGTRESVGLTAAIPIEKPPGDDVTLTVTASTGETGQLTRDTGFKFSGSIFLDGSKLTDKKTVMLTLTPPSGTTVVSCPQATFDWTAPIKPVIETFEVPSTVEKGKSFSVPYKVKDADSVSISNIGGNLPLPIGFPSTSINQDTTFTLTATRGSLTVSSAPKTVKVKQEEPEAKKFSIADFRTLDLQTRVTDEFVSVTGIVRPVPPSGTSVAIGVNGTPVATVAVDGSGNFSSQVRLTHRTSTSDLSLSSAGLYVTNCGDTFSPINLRNNNSSSGAGNVINAAIVVPGGGTDSNTASLVVYHGVRVLGGEVSWSGCPAPNQPLSPRGDTIGPNEERTVDNVLCGTECPGHGAKCVGIASISVDTTVGRVFTQSTWTVDIP